MSIGLPITKVTYLSSQPSASASSALILSCPPSHPSSPIFLLFFCYCCCCSLCHRPDGKSMATTTTTNGTTVRFRVHVTHIWLYVARRPHAELHVRDVVPAPRPRHGEPPREPAGSSGVFLRWRSFSHGLVSRKISQSMVSARRGPLLIDFIPRPEWRCVCF